MNITCITFDLDETLWETAPALERAERALHEWIVRTLPDGAGPYPLAELQARRQKFYASIPGIVHDLTQARILWMTALLVEEGCDREQAEMLAKEGFEVFAEWRSRLVPFPGVQETLATLKERYRVGAITNGNADLRRVGIDHLFDVVVSPAEAGAAKPDAAIFHCALDKIGARAQQTVHVGDDPVRDIAGAAALGMKTVWMNPEALAWPDTTDPSDASPIFPDTEIRAIEDLIERLDHWEGAPP